MSTVSGIYDYPLVISSEEFGAITGRDLSIDIEGNEEKKVTNFLNSFHSHIYDYLIYNTGSRRIKNRIIEVYNEELKNTIMRALIVQGEYLIESNSIGLWNGLVYSVNGADLKDTQDIAQKVLSVEAINILMGSEPNILFAGE